MLALEQEHLNPVRCKLKAPFLRKKRLSRERVTPKKQPFCKAAIAAKHKQKQTIIQSPPTPLPSQPSSITSSLFREPSHQSLDRQLVRKKSELLSLQLKCLEMHQKFSTHMESSNRGSVIDYDMTSSDDRTSCTGSRLDKLMAIKARLNRMDFSSCSRMLSAGKQNK